MPCDNKIDDRSEKSNLATNDNSAGSKMSNEVYQTGSKVDVPRDSSSNSAHGVLPELSITDSSAKNGAAASGDKPASTGQSSLDGKQLADSSSSKNFGSDSSPNSAVDGLNATVAKFEKDITQAVDNLGSEVQAFTNKLSQVLEPYNSKSGPNFQNTQNNYLNDWMGRSSQSSDSSTNSSAQNFQPGSSGNDLMSSETKGAAAPASAPGADWSSRMADQGFQPGAFTNSNQNFMQQFADSGSSPQNFNFNPAMAGQLSAANDSSSNQFPSDSAPVSQTASNYQNNNLNSWFGQPASGDSASLATAQSGQSGQFNQFGQTGQTGGDASNVVPASFTNSLTGQGFQNSTDSSVNATGGAPGDIITPQAFQDNLNKQSNQPQSDGGYVAPTDAAPVSTTASTPTDQVQTTVDDNGKVTGVGSYNAMDNTLSQYKIGADGNVESRSVTNMNDGSVDTVGYAANQEPISHQITKDGQTTDAPIDSSDQVSTTLNSDGSLQSLESRKSDGGSNVYFDSNGQAVKQNSMTLGNGQASTVVNQDLGADGKPTSTSIENRDQNGALRSKIEQDGSETTSKSYDSNQALVQTDIQNPGSEKVITPTADGAKEVTTYDNGSSLTTIKNNDGSSAQATVDNANNSSEFQVKNADGSGYDLKTNASGQEYTENQPNGYSYDRKTSAGSDEITVTEADGSLHSYKDGVNGTEVTEIKPDHSSYELKIDPNGDQKETITNGTTGEIATSTTTNGVTTESTGQGKVVTGTDISYNPDAPNGAPVADTPAPVADAPAPVADATVNPVFDTTPTFDATPTFDTTPAASDSVSPIDTSSSSVSSMDSSSGVEPAMSSDSSYSGDSGGGE